MHIITALLINMLVFKNWLTSNLTEPLVKPQIKDGMYQRCINQQQQQQHFICRAIPQKAELIEEGS